MADDISIGMKQRVASRVAVAVLAVWGIFLSLLASTAASYADNRQVPPLPAWQAPELRDHPLAGKIWSRATGGFVSVQDYGTALARARFTLLGEVHDNADHHALQAWALRTIAKLRGARLVEGAPQMGVVAMEMLTDDEQEALDRFYGRDSRAPRSRTAEDFGRMLKWDKSGWPDFKIYAPIVEEALAAHLSIVPASPSRAENRKVSKEGLGALSAEEVKRLALVEPLADALAADLAEEIKESHCGMLPEMMMPNMSLVQRLRDARMADAMLVSITKGAALIAGNGHVRRDRGVPWYLKRRGIADTDVVVVSHIEVSAGKTALTDYDLGESNPARDLSDFVIFTPRQTRPAPCEEMRQQMEAIKAKRNAKDNGTTSDGAKSPAQSPEPPAAASPAASSTTSPSEQKLPAPAR